MLYLKSITDGSDQNRNISLFDCEYYKSIGAILNDKPTPIFTLDVTAIKKKILGDTFILNEYRYEGEIVGKVQYIINWNGIADTIFITTMSTVNNKSLSYSKKSKLGDSIQDNYFKSGGKYLPGLGTNIFLSLVREMKGKSVKNIALKPLIGSEGFYHKIVNKYDSRLFSFSENLDGIYIFKLL